VYVITKESIERRRSNSPLPGLPRLVDTDLGRRTDLKCRRYMFILLEKLVIVCCVEMWVFLLSARLLDSRHCR